MEQIEFYNVYRPISVTKRFVSKGTSQRKSGNVFKKVDSPLQLGTITTDFIMLHCITSAHIKAQSCSQDDGEL